MAVNFVMDFFKGKIATDNSSNCKNSIYPTLNIFTSHYQVNIGSIKN